jgi:hypothetical protein
MTSGRRANRQRRALGRAVSEAEFAVLAAQVTGAPTGRLDALCHRLRLAAQEADRDTGRGTADLLTAARMIQDAAAAAIASLSAPAEGPAGGSAGGPASGPDQWAAIAALLPGPT